MNRYAYVPPPPVPSTLNVGSEPKVEHNETGIEGLVTWTLVRLMGRLKSAKETGNDRKHRSNHEVSAVGRAAGILLVPLAKCLEHGQGEDHHRTLR